MVNIQDIRTALLYDPKEQFWIEVRGNTARVGMTPLAQETTGSFVSVQFAAQGAELVKGQSFGSIEAEKHVGHLKSPLSGTLLGYNDKVNENPRLVNTDPYGEGWLVEITMSNPDELSGMVQGEAQVRAWFESEIKKFQDKGWLAE